MRSYESRNWLRQPENNLHSLIIAHISKKWITVLITAIKLNKNKRKTFSYLQSPVARFSDYDLRKQLHWSVVNSSHRVIIFTIFFNSNCTVGLPIPKTSPIKASRALPLFLSHDYRLALKWVFRLIGDDRRKLEYFFVLFHGTVNYTMNFFYFFFMMRKFW